MVGEIKYDLKFKIIIKNQLGNIDSEYEFPVEDDALKAFNYVFSNEWFG